MTGPSLHGIQSKGPHPLHGLRGRFLKDGSTEYRAEGTSIVILPQAFTREVYLRVEREGLQRPFIHCPTRKAAIERIEQVLCGDAA